MAFHLFVAVRLQWDSDRHECWISAGLLVWHREMAESLERICSPNTHTHSLSATQSRVYCVYNYQSCYQTILFIGFRCQLKLQHIAHFLFIVLILFLHIKNVILDHTATVTSLLLHVRYLRFKVTIQVTRNHNLQKHFGYQKTGNYVDTVVTTILSLSQLL